ncbi:hypothetical protein PRIPAC_82181, partial [Pristionchus pacificus]|uniref:G protein-coupled receptor n=1 Tax=Pristionchus pacificus TaxID=54126 RepID=A0A2A6BX05_PRIPA
MVFLVGIWFWIPVFVILIPSFILHLTLIMVIRERQKAGHYKSLFYRLFLVQSHLELPLLLLHLFGRFFIKDQYAGRALILSTNGGFFPNFYYYGTISYYLHVQTWGVILQSAIRFINICSTQMTKVIAKAPNYVWYLTNALAPFAIMSRLLFLESVSFKPESDGNVGISTPPIVVQSNSMHGFVVTSFATVFSSICYVVVMIKIVARKQQLTSKKYHKEKQLTVVGFALFLAQCAMTTSYLMIAFAASNNMPLVTIMRRIYILPALLLTFINAWMLTLLNSKLRK